MATYVVNFIEERADGKIAMDTDVFVDRLNDEDEVYTKKIDHFTCIISAAAVLELAQLDKPTRIAGYLALFSADPRISGIIDSEAAVVQMEADVNFPTAAIDI